MAKDPDVDIVYVSNIHPAHKDASILMMNHGKHVLCEKPLAVSPDSMGFTASVKTAASSLVHSQCITAKTKTIELHASTRKCMLCPFAQLQVGCAQGWCICSVLMHDTWQRKLGGACLSLGLLKKRMQTSYRQSPVSPCQIAVLSSICGPHKLCCRMHERNVLL